MNRKEMMLNRIRNYKVVPMTPDHADDAAMLGRMLRENPEAVADPKRLGFYWVEGGPASFYVNVHDRTRTIYLVAVSREISAEPVPPCEPACVN